MPVHGISAHRAGRRICSQENEVAQTLERSGGTMRVGTRYLGKPLKRKEDPRLIQGLAHYVDDIVLPGLLHVAFHRSPYAHARIRSVDVSKARAAPGVVQVLTGADVRGSIGDVPCAAQIPDMKAASRPERHGQRHDRGVAAWTGPGNHL